MFFDIYRSSSRGNEALILFLNFRSLGPVIGIQLASNRSPKKTALAILPNQPLNRTLTG
jgi:hypothetical protein